MANKNLSSQPTAADFSTLLHNKFTELNSLPFFDTDFLSENDDWYLLCFLREQLRKGHSYEVTLSALNSMVGVLSEDSYFFNPINNNVGFLNQNHHLLGESGR